MGIPGARMEDQCSWGCVSDLRSPSFFNASLNPWILYSLAKILPDLLPRLYTSNNRMRAQVDELTLMVRDRGKVEERKKEAENRYLRQRVHCSEGQGSGVTLDCRDRSWGNGAEASRGGWGNRGF